LAGSPQRSSCARLACKLKPRKPKAPDLQVLKDKMQWLDQEMQELKGEIEAVEQGQPTPFAPPTANEKASTEKERSELNETQQLTQRL
jgi:hypothetical protein